MQSSLKHSIEPHLDTNFGNCFLLQFRCDRMASSFINYHPTILKNKTALRCWRMHTNKTYRPTLSNSNNDF
jgi:hypothetical protein